MCSQSAGTFLIRIASETGIGYSSGYSFCRPCWLLGTWIFRLYWDARSSGVNLEIHDLPRMSLSVLRIFVCLHRLLDLASLSLCGLCESVSLVQYGYLTDKRRKGKYKLSNFTMLSKHMTYTFNNAFMVECLHAGI